MSIFQVYKGGQGKYVRVGTLIGIAILMLFGMYWVGHDVLGGYSPIVQTIAVLLFGALWAVAGLYAVNHPRTAEFLIMTESEMRKVNWPSRQVVMNSTKVVIFLTLMMGVMLFLVDEGFVKFFEWIKILSK